MGWGFSDPELLISTADGRNFTLQREFTYTRKSGEVITVPIRIKSDGGSTPRILWNIFPPFGKGWRAYVLHDDLYGYTQRPKAECDDILFEAMECLGVEKIEADIIYEAVRFGGQSAFDEDRAAQNQTEAQKT